MNPAGGQDVQQRVGTTRGAILGAVVGCLLLALGIWVGTGLRPPPTPAPVAPLVAPDAPSLTAEQVRAIVAEELARHGTAGGPDRPARPAVRAADDADGASPAPEAAPAAADPPLDAAQLDSVKRSLMDARRLFLEYDLRYEVGPGGFLERPDPARLARFPDERVWPSRPLGFVQQDPGRYRMVDATGEGFDPMLSNRGFVFTAPLDRTIASSKYATFVFEKGVASSGTLSTLSYAMVLCRGDMDGKLMLDSYATVIIEGNLTGSIQSTSYATVLVLGGLSGTFESRSYANLRVGKGFTGKASVFDGNNLYFAGYTAGSALDAIEFKGRATVTLESSDLASGPLPERKSVEIRVLGEK